MPRRLVVNADDLGLTAGVSAGIVEAHVRGIVTSTSAMVRQPGAAEAALLAAGCPRLDVGLHVDLAEWTFSGGTWLALYERVDVRDAAAVTREVEAQLALFTDLFGHPPTHLDSHQHLHRHQPLRDVLVRMGRELEVPVRGAGAVHYIGDFYGQLATGEPWPRGITVEALLGALARVPSGTSELACHPGRADGLRATGTMYVDEREREMRALCDPRVRHAIAGLGIELTSFRSVH